MLRVIFRKISIYILLCFLCNIGFQLQADVYSNKQNQTKICLTMIVKNESKIIERCLNSVKDIVDCISICDTGSTDNTVELIEAFLENTGIPGIVHQHNWKNFGHNRSLSITAAQTTLRDLKFSLPNTYLLFIDADMLFGITPEFNKSTLIADSYLVEQRHPSLSWYNTRLARASLPWECVGVTHEYYACKTGASTTSINTLYIDDIGDGGSKDDKFDRDIRLLTQGLKDEPDNMRYMFYLAQSYHCLGNHNEAIKWYQARIEAGGWQEEVWYSKYQIGGAYENLNDWENALKYYLDAFQSNPARAEPLEKIAKHYRLYGQNNLAYIFAEQGRSIPYPTNEYLFVEHPVYNYRFDEEISIAAYYTTFKEEGFNAADRLVTNRKSPGHVRDLAYNNMLFYIKNIPNTTFIPLEINPPMVREDLNLSYKVTNPSILKTDDGYTVICKTVNYTQEGARIYKPIDPDVTDLCHNISTRNILLKYTKEFSLISQHEIIDNLSETIKQPIRGCVYDIEDCRIFADNPVEFTATMFDVIPENRVKIGLCELANEPIDSHFDIERMIPFPGPIPQRTEKNWLPFVQNNTFYVIYSYDPFTIYAIDKETGDHKEYINDQPENYFGNFRGSAGPVPFDEGYLVVTHEVVFKQDRFYIHRFLYLDQDFKITKISKPFTYKHTGIEFCSGMAIDHLNKNLIMTVGIEDAEGFFTLTDLDTVRSMLQPLDKR